MEILDDVSGKWKAEDKRTIKLKNCPIGGPIAVRKVEKSGKSGHLPSRHASLLSLSGRKIRLDEGSDA